MTQLMPANWKEILEGFRGNYNYEHLWELAVSETIDNSLDAGATEIQIEVKNNSISFKDNGKGMTSDSFHEYHSIGTRFEKWREDEDSIGFVGMGSKLCLDLTESIYTETRRGNAIQASLWTFDHQTNNPVYDIDTDVEGVLKHNGTYVRFNQFPSSNLSETNIRLFILLKYEFSNIDIYVNGSKVARAINYDDRLDGASTIKRTKTTKRIGLSYSFRLTKNPITDPGIKLCFLGRTIEAEEFFGLRISLGDESNRIHGYIRCDQLKPVIRSSKDGFNMQRVIFKQFRRRAAQLFEAWCRSNKLIDESSKGTAEFKNLFQTVQREFRKVIIEFPDLMSEINMRAPTKNNSSKNSGESESVTKRKPTIAIKNGENKKAMPHIVIRSDQTKGPAFIDTTGRLALNISHPACKYAARSRAGRVFAIYALLEHLVSACYPDEEEKVQKMRQVYEKITEGK